MEQFFTFKKMRVIKMTMLIKLFLIYIQTIIIIGCNGNNVAKKKNFQKQLGTYVLDIRRTNLGSYAKDSDLFKNLYITFKEDSTFIMNMKTPFIYDSIGIWNVGGTGVEAWNYLSYKRNRNITTQFTQPWTSDSIFYMNSTTPRDSADFIQEIYFKKIISH